MIFAHGLSIDIDVINRVLEIEDSFEFSILELNICIKLEKNIFIECYTEFLNQY